MLDFVIVLILLAGGVGSAQAQSEAHAAQVVDPLPVPTTAPVDPEQSPTVQAERKRAERYTRRAVRVEQLAAKVAEAARP
jgi:hypothetical protein